MGARAAMETGQFEFFVWRMDGIVIQAKPRQQRVEPQMTYRPRSHARIECSAFGKLIDQIRVRSGEA